MLWVRMAGVLFVLWVGVVAGIVTESGVPPALIFSLLVAVGVWRLLKTRRNRSRLYAGEIDESCLICGSASLEQLEAEYEYRCRECGYDSEAARGPQTAHLARWIDTVAGASRALGDTDQGMLASAVATGVEDVVDHFTWPGASGIGDEIENERGRALLEALRGLHGLFDPEPNEQEQVGRDRAALLHELRAALVTLQTKEFQGLVVATNEDLLRLQQVAELATIAKPAEEAVRLTSATRATYDKLKNELMQRLKEETVVQQGEETGSEAEADT